MKKALGIYNQNLFILDDNSSTPYVIRPVSIEQLEYMRSDKGQREYCQELWKEEVAHNCCECSLDEYTQSYIEELDKDDQENFIGKDDSFCDIFDIEEGLRDLVDKYLLFTEGLEVGTWESSGIYPPKGQFDMILNRDAVEDFYKRANL